MGDCERERLITVLKTWWGGGRAFLELRVVLWALLVIFIFFV